MDFRTVISSGKEVLFGGRERGHSKLPDDWLKAGRWKIDMSALDSYLALQYVPGRFATKDTDTPSSG